MLILDLKSPPTREEIELQLDIMIATTPMMIEAVEQGTRRFDPKYISRQHRVLSYIKANLHKITEGLPK